jgi:hypothetical protein
MRRFVRFLVAPLILMVPFASAGADTPVDIALVLAVDASGSIDADEFKLQKEGIAGAVTSEPVLSAIGSGPNRRVAIAYVEWGSPGGAATVVNWAIVEDAASAGRFASAVLVAPRSPQSYNAIGDAITHGAALIQACPCKPIRGVIDISGDNRDNRSLTPALVARQAAAAQGITVNALAVLEGDRAGSSGKPWLVEEYERGVIAGPGAFVIAARDRADFARALLQKMVREFAAAPAERAEAGRQ